MNTPPRAWLTRSGRYGERDDWALASGVTPGASTRCPTCPLRIPERCPGDLWPQPNLMLRPNAVGNFAAQLWALAGRMAIGDYVVLPRKATSQVAIGRITGDYEYRADDPDPDKRHVRPVEWLRTGRSPLSDQAGPAVLARSVLHLLPGEPERGCRPDRRDRRDGVDPGTKVTVKPLPQKPSQHGHSATPADAGGSRRR